jgi:5-formyltetrahydrofolate cyclo-ligase
MSQKSLLRQEMLAKRSALSVAKREAAQLRFLRHAHEKLAIHSGKLLAGYAPIRGEISVIPALEAWGLQGGQVALPRMVVDSSQMQFHLADLNTLEEGPYGILQPPEVAPVVVPEVILVPLLAYDNHGNRLGYGGGYYDRYFAAQKTQPITYGCAFRFQHHESLPVEAHDYQLLGVITD